MTTLNRLLLVLMIVVGITLVPLSSAAGDPSTDGGTGTSTGSGTGTGGSTDGGSGGAAAPGLSTPRVILAGFSTEPADVVAGQDFTLAFTLRNTSTRTRVQNLLVTLSSADSAFLPANGSSSIFISRIRADQLETASMRFHSLPSLEEKPHALTMTIAYEDAAANAFSATETISIRVRQTLRAEVSAPQLLPPQLVVGQDASLTFNIVNQGKAKLYNATASIADGQPLTSAEVFVGSVDPGSSSAVDMTVNAAREGMEEVTVTVTYEDVEGNLTTMEHSVAAPITAPMPVEEPGPGENVGEETAFPWLPVIAAVVLVGGVVFVAALVRRRRRLQAEQEDLESLADLDEAALIGPQPR